MATGFATTAGAAVAFGRPRPLAGAAATGFATTAGAATAFLGRPRPGF
ncbi:MAG: hypothetical protein IPK11_06795 [Ignavibacteria bacterium]|nr:hypothetical protein [Ignavibacteria bacterium]